MPAAEEQISNRNREVVSDDTAHLERSVGEGLRQREDERWKEKPREVQRRSRGKGVRRHRGVVVRAPPFPASVARRVAVRSQLRKGRALLGAGLLRDELVRRSDLLDDPLPGQRAPRSKTAEQILAVLRLSAAALSTLENGPGASTP